MIKFSIKSDLELSKEEVIAIAALKSKRWIKYSINDHLNWYRKNRKDNNEHILLHDDNNLVGYATILNDIILESKLRKYKAIGIASVCTSESGKGYGIILLQRVNEVIERKSKPGFLLTSEKNFPFYEKKEWEVADIALKKELKAENIVGMLLDYRHELKKKSLEFNGELF